MVNIDTVYQRVLAIANKEQRGYITPIEFNLLANQAQLDIFEQYFYDRSQTERAGGNDLSNIDPDHILDEKIDIFKFERPLAGNNELPAETYRVQSIFISVNKFGTGSGVGNAPRVTVECEKVDSKDIATIRYSKLLHPTIDRPIYTRNGAAGQVNVYIPDLVDGTFLPRIQVRAHVIRRPIRAEWGYVVVNERALYNASRATNFELHASEETNLVNKILEGAGIILNKPGLVQIADQEDIKRIQQQKM
jgi:hypothetical protein